MFLIGKIQGQKNTKTGLMLSIMNFDFTITSIIITCCIDKKQNTKNNKGNMKHWIELLDAFKTFYTNANMITDLEGLHILRNSIQHGDTIPSNFDVSRNEKLVKDFFDDICNNVYSGAITYDKISIAKLMKSPHEMEIMGYVEGFIEEKKFDLAMQLIQTLALYHYALVKTNLVYPQVPNQMFSTDHNITRSLTDVYGNMDNMMDKLAFGKHYSQLKQILEYPNRQRRFDIDKKFPYQWIQELLPSVVSLDQIENYRILIYDIIFGTEHHLTDKLVVDVPLVYGAYLQEINQNSVIIKFGVLSKLSIDECRIKLFHKNKEVKSYPHIVKKGYNEFILYDIIQGRDYICTITVSQKEDPDFENTKSINYAILKLNTR